MHRTSSASFAVLTPVISLFTKSLRMRHSSPTELPFAFDIFNVHFLQVAPSYSLSPDNDVVEVRNESTREGPGHHARAFLRPTRPFHLVERT